MEEYSGVKTALGSLENERRAIKSNHLAVFATSLQCTDEVNLMSGGNQRPLTQLTVGMG